MTFNDILVKIDDVVWGIPTIILILFTGLLLTIRCRGIQFTKLGRAFKQIFKKNEGAGELSGFSALCTALSATIGTGNIVGAGGHRLRLPGKSRAVHPPPLCPRGSGAVF